jgi:hypothetical protein
MTTHEWTMALTNWKEIADVITAALTTYLSARAVYIWYKYLRLLVPEHTAGSFLARLKKSLEDNPPSAFPTADLPIATIALVLSSGATVLLFLGLKLL